jgi:hypothetical protein
MKTIFKVILAFVLCFCNSANVSAGEQVKYLLPEKINSCTSRQTSLITNRESRHMAYFDRSWWFESVTLFDIAEECTVSLRFTGLCPPKTDGAYAACKLGNGEYQVGTVFSVKSYPYQLVHRFLEAYELTSRGTSDYNEWKTDRANRIKAKQEEEVKRKEAAEIKSNQLKDMHNLLREKHCANFSNVGYFCYDDNNKLANQDINAMSKLLRKVTQEILNNKHLGSYYNTESTDVVGQWFVESITEKSISVTIMMGPQLLGETVIDRLSKAGKLFYVINENSTKTYK